MGPLRFSKGEVKVTFTRSFQLVKVTIVSGGSNKVTYLQDLSSWKGLEM